MKPIGEIVGKVSNCGGESANTGKLGCLQSFGTPLGLILTKKGFKIDKTQVIDTAFLEINVQNGNLIPVMGASSFEDVSSEDTNSTNAAGVERLNLQGLPKYKLMFEEGHEFYRQMTKLTSFKSKGAIIIDDYGRWLMGVNSDGDFVGMTAGQITAEMRKTKVQGGDAESRSLTIQFLDRLQWDYSYGIVERTELGFTSDEVPTINGVDIDFSEAPVDTDTTLTISARLSADNNSTVEGLIADDFVVTVDGASEIPSNVTETAPGVYVLTVSALATGNVIVAQLFDSVANLDVIINEEILYRSNMITATV